MGKNQWHNRQHLGALENSIIGHFLSIMWKSLPAAWIRCGYQLNVPRRTNMPSIHSPDYVFTVLVSIFMKTHNHFLSSMQCYKYVYTVIYSKSDGVLHFHYSRWALQMIPTTLTYVSLQHYLWALWCPDMK